MLFATTALMAQTKTSPYLNGGVSIQNNSLSYDGEIGIGTSKNRFAATVQSTTATPENVWSLGAKSYFRLNRGISAVDTYATGAVSMDLTKFHTLTFEPGVAATWNITKSRFAPQASLAFPIQQNAVLRNRPLGVSGGISLNYRL